MIPAGVQLPYTDTVFFFKISYKMPKLTFADYLCCFKKQFVFQKGHGGRRISGYYTALNSEQGLKNDMWAMMVMIYTGNNFGFTDLEILDELRIKTSLYKVLKEEVLNVIHHSYPDKNLHRKVKIKIGLVNNAMFYTHKVRPVVETKKVF